jgi:drug/metabolite transporter (DMT)-like permease
VIRYAAATSLFFAFTYWRERTFRIAKRHLPLVALAALLILLNQLCFVYGIKLTTAATVALILGSTPAFAGIAASLVGLERLSRIFWVAAALSFAGVALVALGSSSGFSGHVLGDLLAVATAATWAFYSVSITPLMRDYSPFRVSALVLVLGWIPLAVVGARQVGEQQFSFGWPVWLGFAYAVVGPLFLTNILWFTAIGRVGPSRAALFANLQPFFAVVFALILLHEGIAPLQVVGGLLIAAGIAAERRSHRRAEEARLEAEAPVAAARLRS